ncbi:type II toxin-antitoxin system CcdA family antitoxin [Roseomonas sp. 18066]|uniref:type II toxin-antitoxin system CcdA family antitoxin n=1 Tax=Roseomonas sp. 18066 TaxID=2681412 RepID=UPI00135C589A|nr:type II toxin-antitoxin system CcdA family antitoxin [Roseomonas sp. 18066]
MGYDRNAPKRAINVTINADLLTQARAYTRNVNGTLEALLAAFVEQEAARRRAEDAAIDRVVDGANRFQAGHGLLSDEFSTL